MDIKRDEFEFPYYESQPPGTRVAIRDDFYDDSGRLVIKKPFLVRSWYSGKYEAYRMRGLSTMEWIEVFLIENRVFVWYF